jgi:hypothetical protein
MRRRPDRGSLGEAMSDAGPERATYDRVADAIAEALRTLAHDAANCAAVFDMEIGELGGADATGAGDSLRAATERLRAHVQDLRVFSTRRDATALDELLAFSLRVLSRSARRDLTRTAGDREACLVRGQQLPVLLSLLVVLRAILKATEGNGLRRASARPDKSEGTVTFEVAMDDAELEAVASVARGVVGGIGSATTATSDDGQVLTLRFPLA